MSPADWELAKANTLATLNPNPLDHDAQVAACSPRVTTWRSRRPS